VHQRDEALELISKSSKLVSAKGKKVVEVQLKKTDLSEEEILKLALGPTGNLRAPTILVGKTMVVGFNEDMYETALS
jgi:arsenate reductase-like glutaredoxin family protein